MCGATWIGLDWLGLAWISLIGLDWLLAGISPKIWGIPRGLMTSQKLRIGSKVKVKPTQVKAEVKYANEGRHLGFLRHPWPLIG